MKSHLTALVALIAAALAVLAAPSAWSCPALEEEPPVVTPTPAAGFELPLDGFLYIEENRDSQLFGRSWARDQYTSTSVLMHPDGTVVDWEIVVTKFSDRVSQARPAGGWQVGEYTAWSDDTIHIVYVVVDVVDEEPPELDIVRWTGASAHPEPPAPCSSQAGDPAGIELELGAMSEPIVLTWEFLDEDGQVVNDGAKFFTDPAAVTVFVPASTASTGEVRLEAVDLSGNRASVSSTDVVACDGCSGSLSASPARSLWALALFPLGALRRRRSPRTKRCN